MTKKSIAIIGAGIIGITSAYLLKKAGYKVILLDAEQGPALKTSYANGCQLSYSYVDAMSSPSLVKKMPKIIAGMDPAFRIKLSTDIRLASWGSKFLSNARSEKEQSNTQHLMRLSQHSQHVLHALLSESKLEFEHRTCGKLLIYTNQNELDKALKRVEQKLTWGCEQRILSAKQCLELEPNLEQLTQPIVGGIYTETDEVGDPHHFANQLLKMMSQDDDFEPHFNCRVTQLVKKANSIDYLATSSGEVRADVYVLATGPESLTLAQDIGVTLPIYPIKGYSITVPATKHAPEVCVTDIANKVVVSRVGDKLRMAGCADIVGDESNIEKSRIDHLLKVCMTNFPRAGIYSEIIHTWAGFRPVTPSSVPIIGQAGADNLFLNIGHGMFGWTLATGSASLLTAQVNQQTPPIDPTGMTPRDHGIAGAL
ncbi:hypothetical protein BIY22_18975 [Vibrio panuliri]|uniref:FAD dependent oxidoreductase domain-containing protein n=1 Tax=Vibrio panuliri TaxID=1381081 RepID=A0A1Q9HKU4_9VIBR|nr:D-amino acid dehydrogenase [Vibrio panuliri]OLQ90981.1 hypothetical protein BIY22_18975 [Vibrio panuliri]